MNDLPLANPLMKTRAESVDQHSFANRRVSFIVVIFLVLALAFVLQTLVDILDCASDSPGFLG